MDLSHGKNCDVLIYIITLMILSFWTDRSGKQCRVTACHVYFTHFGSSRSLGGAKTGDPQENHLTTRKQNLACLTSDRARLEHRVMCPKDANRMANSVDADQTAPSDAIWSGPPPHPLPKQTKKHYSVVKSPCSNFRVITANFSGVWIFRIFRVNCCSFTTYSWRFLLTANNLVVESLTGKQL